MPIDSRRITLGTVQFGLAYGVANTTGQVSVDEAAVIVEHAWSAGLHTLDTAIAYGDSEQRLGQIGVSRWQIFSKLPALPDTSTDAGGWVLDSVVGSLERLRVSRLRGLLLHRSQQLLSPNGDALYAALVALKDQGLVEKIGVSVYAPEELDALWPRFQLEVVQAPFNVFDRRLLTSGWLARLHQSGTEVHVRSVFLQGLLLMDGARRPATFRRWQSLWDRWDRWVDGQRLTKLQACLGFVASQPQIDAIVTGVDNLQQLQEILSAARGAAIDPPIELMSRDRDLVDPSRWVTRAEH